VGETAFWKGPVVGTRLWKELSRSSVVEGGPGRDYALEGAALCMAVRETTLWKGLRRNQAMEGAK